jgi:signal transduction histidine kinase
VPATDPNFNPDPDFSSANALESAAAQQILRLRELNDYLLQKHEKEKKLLARVLHDELGSALTSLSIHLQSVYGLLPDDEKNNIRRDRIQTSLAAAVDTTRRLQSELRPTMLELFGLKFGIEEFLKTFGERTGLACLVSLPDEEVHLDDRTSIAVYRMLEELLCNVEAHANATKVDVILDIDEDGLTLTVRDDGKGIDAASLYPIEAHGIRGLQERARFFGGQLVIKTLSSEKSPAADATNRHGATVSIRLPHPLT